MTRVFAVLIAFILATALCLVMILLLLPRPADSQTVCQTQAMIKADVARAMPTARVATLGGGEARILLAAVNAMPPLTQFTADEITVIEIKDTPRVAIVLFTGGCVTHVLFIESAKFHQLLQSL